MNSAIISATILALFATTALSVRRETLTGEAVTSFSSVNLFVQYTWQYNETDLDTKTSFLSKQVGYSCGARKNEYMTFDGDNTERGQQETATVLLHKAFADGELDGGVAVIKHSAHWHSRRGGYATMRIVLKDKVSGKEIKGTGVNLNITPRRASGCSRHRVAQTFVVKKGDKLVTILSNEVPSYTKARKLAGLA